MSVDQRIDEMRRYREVAMTAPYVYRCYGRLFGVPGVIDEILLIFWKEQRNEVQGVEFDRPGSVQRTGR